MHLVNKKQQQNRNTIFNVCKPCWKLKYCPYGELVEQFPLPSTEELRGRVKKMKCGVFGHICPVFIAAERFAEGRPLPQEYFAPKG